MRLPWEASANDAENEVNAEKGGGGNVPSEKRCGDDEGLGKKGRGQRTLHISSDDGTPTDGGKGEEKDPNGAGRRREGWLEKMRKCRAIAMETNDKKAGERQNDGERGGGGKRGEKKMKKD
ncbi:hypothetical protein niasHT_009041 [Heterodera trifolii]|uniref:Uncharacterized protein n=1 Tax=Heterodera trifolii TaxID=157864 RepID=A0ABD2M273_9BILA